MAVAEAGGVILYFFNFYRLNSAWDIESLTIRNSIYITIVYLVSMHLLLCSNATTDRYAELLKYYVTCGSYPYNVIVI